MAALRWRALVLVLGLSVLGQCGGSASSVDAEVRNLQKRSCLEAEPSVDSEVKVNTSRVTAAWSCAVSTPWAQYLAKLDAIPGYQRRSSTAAGAVYGRSTDTDYYVLTITVSPDVPGRVHVGFSAGPY